MPGTVFSAVYILSLISHNGMERGLLCLHFIDEKTEGERAMTQNLIYLPDPLGVWYEDELPMLDWLLVHSFQSLKEETKS